MSLAACRKLRVTKKIRRKVTCPREHEARGRAASALLVLALNLAFLTGKFVTPLRLALETYACQDLGALATKRV